MTIKAKLVRECVKSICWENSHDAALIPIGDMSSDIIDALMELITSLDRTNYAVLPRQGAFTKQQWLYMLQLEKHHRDEKVPLEDSAIEELYRLFISPTNQISPVDHMKKSLNDSFLEAQVTDEPIHLFKPWSGLSKELAEARDILCKFPYKNDLGVIKRIEQCNDQSIYQISQRCKMRASRNKDAVEKPPFTNSEWFLILELERIVRSKCPKRKRLQEVTSKIPQLLEKYGLKETVPLSNNKEYYIYRIEQKNNSCIKSYVQINKDVIRFHSDNPTFLSKEAASTLAAFYNTQEDDKSVKYDYTTQKYIISYNGRYIVYSQHPVTLGISLTHSQKQATSFSTVEEAEKIVTALSLMFPCIDSSNCKTLDASVIFDTQEVS